MYFQEMNMNSDINKKQIKQELSEILAKYYDGSFVRLVQKYICICGKTYTTFDSNSAFSPQY